MLKIAVIVLLGVMSCAGSKRGITQENFPVKKAKANSEKLDCTSDEFRGKKRAAVKTAVVSATLQNYGSLDEFMQSLQADSTMTRLCKASTTTSTLRIEAEQRNVRVKNVFIYAIVREDDNDFHIIIGDEKGNYFNVENSGLPPENSPYYPALLKARKQFEDKFGEFCHSRYKKFEKPIEVEIEGSLFYDIDHKPGVVGPAGMRPTTSWEIHPVTDMKFK